MVHSGAAPIKYSPSQHNGRSELKLISSHCPRALNPTNFDCVLLDYRLPDGDGLALVKAVRRAGIKVPLVVLTGQGDEQIAVDLMKAGASDYLPKSKVSPETLSRSLRHAVRIYRAEREAELATQRLRESEERYRLVLEGSNDGIWDWDIVTQDIYCNDRLYEIIGLFPSRHKITPELFFERLHPEDQARVKQAVDAHLQDLVELNLEFRLLHTSGEYRYCIARGKAQRDAQGNPLRISGVVSDITQRKRAEESLRFLAEASTLLSASLDYQTTLENLAKLAVPRLADWCAIDVVRPDLTYSRLAVAHVNPEKEKYVWELQRRYPPKGNEDYGYPKVLRTGKSYAHFDVSDEFLSAIARDPGHLELFRQLNSKSYICVPLQVGDKTLGSISFVWSESGRRYTQADLELAEDLARRAALAAENAKLYREAQEASQSLRQVVTILDQQQQQLRTLQQLTNLLNQRLTNLPCLLREMVGALVKTIPGAEFCFIMLKNPQCNGLLLSVTAGIGTEKLRFEDALPPSLRDAPPTETLLSEVFVTGKSQLIQRLDKDSQHMEDVPAAMYSVTIESVQAGRLGVLAIGNWQNPNAFDEEDQKLLVAVGEQAAIAIDNARMIKALEEQETRLEFQNQMLAQQNQELESQRQQVLRQNEELESQRQQVLRQNVQLLEAARLKSQFLATMSHELRTPMNAVIGFSQLLLRQRQSSLIPQQVDMVERILNNGKNLLTLINEILDLSKIEAGRLELKLENFNLVKLLRATVEELRSLAEEKHLELNIKADLQNPNVSNDSVRLRQIVVNLLSNAIKFTESGKVQVEVKEISEEQLAIIVKDTGIGIAQEDLEHIFEEFRQIDQTTTRKYSGTGLGLAITESLVKLMQGTITVESQLGVGSTFRIELPRQVPADAPCKCSPSAKPGNNATASPSVPSCSHQLNHCNGLKVSAQNGSVSSESLQGSGIGKILY
ncbi:MAG: GAF domain-containing protein [Symploca sp. SIO1B1]|nr:GAF domain-containing protein [Symploca sp. SIO1C2]NER94253.1 GAF domain-containing protein [Symploca sp. SIO1B1]